MVESLRTRTYNIKVCISVARLPRKIFGRVVNSRATNEAFLYGERTKYLQAGCGNFRDVCVKETQHLSTFADKKHLSLSGPSRNKMGEMITLEEYYFSRCFYETEEFLVQ